MDTAQQLAFGTAAYEHAASIAPGVLRWNGVDYACAYTKAARNRMAMDGGWRVVQTAAVRVLKVGMASTPGIGQLVELGGERLRVERVGGSNPWDAMWTIHLAQPD